MEILNDFVIFFLTFRFIYHNSDTCHPQPEIQPAEVFLTKAHGTKQSWISKVLPVLISQVSDRHTMNFILYFGAEIFLYVTIYSITCSNIANKLKRNKIFLKIITP